MEDKNDKSEQSSNFPSKIVIGIVIIIIVAGGLIYFKMSRKNSQKALVKNDSTMQMISPKVSQVAPSSVQNEATSSPDESNIKTFTITGQNYKFNPSEISVNEGDKVKIIFKSVGGLHDFVLDQFDVSTKKVFDGQSDTVEFTASKKGTFQYYCSVANHRAMGMVGTLTVN